MSAIRYSIAPSPLGDLILSGAEHLSGVAFTDSRKATRVDADCRRDDGAFAEAASQLRAYFAGELTRFELELDLQGTDFQRRVWAALLQIPYGKTTTYGQLASELGDPKAMRAVGLANGRNPISIIVPCHRVIGSNGSLTGYGGGLPRKQWLLAHERGEVPLAW
ncbi:MAG: methylated-DNA--[protein]-cysteine S-methyltransferase [Chloroflexi bacterium]|nr:methylated-DNA--[protein]-cysteine S-methyltransferase [Chloroflexota bacterium]MBV9894492.1 methylated-DNA--[protein]-cysteine S-methyltransferase [Chloroflexota bacterium]